ncbi:MAG: ChaB family protein [Candidatus Helarchaeota archaeon]
MAELRTAQDVVSTYYNKLLDLAFGYRQKISVPKEYHDQMAQINSLLKDDRTGLISTIIEYMIHSATVDININSDNANVTKILNKWKHEINKDVNFDIPSGLRSFTEQYYRERWKSSFIVLKLIWHKFDGYWLPTKMFFMDGTNIYVKNDSKNLNTNEYFIGKPNSKRTNIIKNKKTTTFIIRKPYNHWYDQYPTPYLVRKGTLYHALFKIKTMERQAEIVETAFPYQFFIKMGSEEAMRKGIIPSSDKLREQKELFQEYRDKLDNHGYSKGTVGAFPHNVNFEELIPDYKKALDRAITEPIDKNILNSLGLIELRGFSSNREEAILNPKILVEEVQDGVKDYVELLSEIMKEVKRRNSGKYSVNTDIRIKPEAVKTFITEDMRTLIRSLYDRGLISKRTTVKNVTDFDFDTQINERKRELQDGLDELMYPQIVQNLEKDDADLSPNKENIPDDKKPGTPEAENYKNGNFDCITEEFKTIRSIPKDIRQYLGKQKQTVFKKAFNKAFSKASELDYDDELRESVALKFAYNEVKKYIQAPYNNTSELPDSIKNNMTKELQKIFMDVVNESLDSGDSESTAFKKAWSVIKKIAHKNNDGKWVKN